EYRRVGEPGEGTGWLFDLAKLRAQLPMHPEPIVWEGSVQPLVLDNDAKGQLYLLNTVQTSRSERDYDVPEGIWYVAFKFESGKWNRISLDQFPRELKPNLLA